eukprot:5444897-Alexandrium_andersonii.AAC.1
MRGATPRPVEVITARHVGIAGALAAAACFPSVAYVAPLAMRVWQAAAVMQHAYAREHVRAWDVPPGVRAPGPRHGPQELEQEPATPGAEPQHRRLLLQ